MDSNKMMKKSKKRRRENKKLRERNEIEDWRNIEKRIKEFSINKERSKINKNEKVNEPFCVKAIHPTPKLCQMCGTVWHLRFVEIMQKS